MSNWLYANEEPTSPWRGALSLPRELSLRRTPAGLRLVQRPVRELDTLRTGAEPVRVAASTALPAAAEFTLEVAASTGRGRGAGLGPAWSRDCSRRGTSAVQRQWGRGADRRRRFTARGLRRSPALACCTARALSRPARGARSRGRWRRPPPRHRRSLDRRSVRQRRRDCRFRSAVAHATVHARGAGERGAAAEAAGDVAAAEGVGQCPPELKFRLHASAGRRPRVPTAHRADRPPPTAHRAYRLPPTAHRLPPTAHRPPRQRPASPLRARSASAPGPRSVPSPSRGTAPPPGRRRCGGRS